MCLSVPHYHFNCLFMNSLRAVWGEPTSAAGSADAAGGVQRGAAGGGDAAIDRKSVV